jgi:hypothetical protein
LQVTIGIHCPRIVARHGNIGWVPIPIRLALKKTLPRTHLCRITHQAKKAKTCLVCAYLSWVNQSTTHITVLQRSSLPHSSPRFKNMDWFPVDYVNNQDALSDKTWQLYIMDLHNSCSFWKRLEIYSYHPYIHQSVSINVGMIFAPQNIHTVTMTSNMRIRSAKETSEK